MKRLTQDIMICNELKYMIAHRPIREGEKLPSERVGAAIACAAGGDPHRIETADAGGLDLFPQPQRLLCF